MSVSLQSFLFDIAQFWLSDPIRRAADDSVHQQRLRALMLALQQTLDDWTEDHALDVDSPARRATNEHDNS